MWFVVVFSIAAALTVIVNHLKIKSRYNYWLRRGIPYSRPIWPFGNVGKLLTSHQSYTELVRKLYYEHPDSPVTGLFILTKPSLLIKEPRMLSRLLGTDYNYFDKRGMGDDYDLDPLMASIINVGGDRWRNSRSAMGPVFSGPKLEKFHQTIVAGSAQLRKTIIAASDAPVDVRKHCLKYTLDLMSCLLFSVPEDTITCSKLNDFILQTFRPSMLLNIRTILRFVLPSIIALFKWKRLPTATERFFYEMVNHRISYNKDNAKPDDILQHLIDNFIFNGKGFGEWDVAANAFGLFVAGVETTGSTLAFCLLELSVHQDIQEKLFQEIVQVLDKHDGNITQAALNDMTFLEQVVSETLRMYPSVSLTGRECTKEYRLGDSEVFLDPGTKLVIPIIVLHYDPKYYPEPYVFKPERFAPENIGKIPRSAYIPFGAGPRICIGHRLAKLELKIGIVTLISKLRFTPSGCTSIPIKFKPNSILLTPTTPILLDVEQRKL